MSLTLAVAVYVVIWWTVLFAVLPFGVRTQAEDGLVVPGTPASAPTRPRLLRVVLLTTLVAGLLFAALMLAIRYPIGTWLGVRPGQS
jgi:predicted secreted protein